MKTECTRNGHCHYQLKDGSCLAVSCDYQIKTFNEFDLITQEDIDRYLAQDSNSYQI